MSEDKHKIAKFWMMKDDEDEHLISAAPDLLKALSAIVHSAEDGCAAINTSLIIKAKAAIAKATGKTQ